MGTRRVDLDHEGGARSETLTADERPRHGRQVAEPSLDHGRYRMLEPLGHGGMGEVIAARDEILGREIAIKRMLETHPSASETSRFLREARIQAALDHPAIPPVHELSRDADGRPFFVMKRLVGTTLRNIIDGLRDRDVAMGERFPLQRLLRAFADVCLAVELAHTRGVVHRDIKPANIMLGEFGEVFVLDWGVAKVVGDFDPALGALHDSGRGETGVGAVIGTPDYMAPEQLRGDSIDGRADVYALGCVLFEIVRGGRSRSEPDSVPPELEEICRAATEVDVEARLANARELAARVQRYLDGDRDLALRRKLAEQHLSRATAAAANVEDQEARRVSMREASRALALDPELHGAADLVGRLMLEPPRTMPPEVETDVRESEAQAVKRNARVSRIAYAAYALFLACWSMYGVRQVGLFGALVLLIAMLLGASWIVTRTNRPYRIAWFIVLGNAAVLALIARAFTPFLIAPCAAALTAIFLIGSPIYRRGWMFRLVLVALPLGVVGAWFVELAGFVPATMSYHENTLVLTLPGIEMNAPPILIALAVFTTAVVISAAIVGRAAGRGNDDAQRRLHLQAWQLRQLVPEPLSTL